MSNKLTMSDKWWSADGMRYEAGPLIRFKTSGLPGEVEAFFADVHCGTRREPLWRIEGKENWQRLKRHCHEAETALHFSDGTELAVDLSEYSPTPSDLLARFLHPNADEAIRGWC
jgi:hypothetical protein